MEPVVDAGDDKYRSGHLRLKSVLPEGRTVFPSEVLLFIVLVLFFSITFQTLKRFNFRTRLSYFSVLREDPELSLLLVE
jgi:hypothetical protein